MADAKPVAGKAIQPSQGHASQGKPAAMIAWGLYLLSLPSANLLAVVGLIVAYAGRGGATGLALAHIEAQIGLFWSVFWWTILLWIGIAICGISFFAAPVTGVILVPLALVLGLALFFLTVWFTIKSIIGLINLFGDKAS
ncbi:MAG: hypothetical protein ACXW3K_07215 [Brevundimonas sp.]